MNFSLIDLIALMLFVALITNAEILNGQYNQAYGFEIDNIELLGDE